MISTVLSTGDIAVEEIKPLLLWILQSLEEDRFLKKYTICQVVVKAERIENDRWCESWCSCM